MHTFTNEYNMFLENFGNGRTMVLSTSENNIVSSRMMSVIRIGDNFYFQTDITFRKYRQLTSNRSASLCADNIQIEGICEELGHPLNNASFCEMFRKCFKGSYDAYTALKNERLFRLTPTFIERWIYKDGEPYIETYDIKTRTYSLNKYIGI